MWFQCMVWGDVREKCVKLLTSEFSKFPVNIFGCHLRHAYKDTFIQLAKLSDHYIVLCILIIVVEGGTTLKNHVTGS